MPTTPDEATNGAVCGHERVLLMAGLSLLPVGALVGAAAGTGVARTTRNVVGAHVHAGSVGWTALAVLAFAGPVIRVKTTPARPVDDGRWASAAAWLAVVASVAIVAAVALDLPAMEGVSGAALVVAVTASIVLVVREGRASTWTTPAIGIVAALVVFLAGSVTGVIAASLTRDGGVVAGRTLAAHAALLTVPYIVLATAAIVEWAVHDDESRVPATTAGTLQVGFAVLSAIALFAGNLNGSFALIQANVPLLLTSIAIFVVRVGPRVFDAGWIALADRMWLGISVAALTVAAGLFLHLLFEVGARRYSSIELVPDWLIFAVDHVSLGVVVTAAVLGAIAGTHPGSRAMRIVDRAAAGATVCGLAAAVAGIGWKLDRLRNVGMAVFGGALVLAAVVAVRRVFAQRAGSAAR